MDFHEFWYLNIFRKSVLKIQVPLKSDKNNGGTGHENQYTFTISRSIVLRIRNVSDKRCRENQNTHFMFNFFSPESHALYEIMWKNTTEPDKPPMTVQYGACAFHAGYLSVQTHTQNM